MGVKFWTSWGVAPTIFKITLLRWLFSKMVSNLTILEGIFKTKFQGWFFFVPNNFYVDFFCKIEGDFNFLVNCFLVQFNFIGISHIEFKQYLFLVEIGPYEFKRDFSYKMHPFASLARAVFLKGFLSMEITHRVLSRPRYRPLLSVLASESESEK